MSRGKASAMQLPNPDSSTSTEQGLESQGTNMLKRTSQGKSPSGIYQSIKHGKVERDREKS